MNRKKVTVGKKTFVDQKLACKFFKIKHATFRTRLRLGFSIKDALTKKNTHENPIFINGIKYKNRSRAGKKFKISKDTVFSRLKAGKNISDALTQPITPVGAHIKLEINEKFFQKIDTKEKSYFLGLMITDGWLSVDGQLTIPKTKRKYNSFGLGLVHYDRHILESFKKNLGTQSKLVMIKPSKYILNGKKYWRKTGYVLKIRNKKIVSDLMKKGIVPRKTHKTSFPSNKVIVPKLISHFIRGVFDGDGSISLSKIKTKIFPQIHFTGASKVFLDKIAKILFQNKVTKKLISVKHQHGKTFRIVFSNKFDLYNFKNYIYKDSNASIRLKRKFERFKKYVV